MGRYEGRVAIVTGASSGIGRATALRLASEGASVACLDVAVDANEATVADIGGAGAGKAVALTCDVSDERTVTSAVDAAVAAFGPPHLLCNVAGIGSFRHTHELTLEDWNRIIAVNLTGTFLVSRACIPMLLETGGSIVNVASVAGLKAQPYSAAYSASKGGVALFTRSVAMEYAETTLRVNAIAPGSIDTAITEQFTFPDGASATLLGRIMPYRAFGRPEDCAAVIAFLGSDEARYVNGAVIPVDAASSA
ncbi:MAG TPA: SDR family NAD(P)-dependent oxidoreductase [Acidimicrobiia bacterium]|nr:SDR family NAD(P)-dependent oxidoreductase [Acidimicrobiia bacterium]